MTALLLGVAAIAVTVACWVSYGLGHRDGFHAGVIHARLGQRGFTVTYSRGAIAIVAPSDRHAAETLIAVCRSGEASA